MFGICWNPIETWLKSVGCWSKIVRNLLNSNRNVTEIDWILIEHIQNLLESIRHLTGIGRIFIENCSEFVGIQSKFNRNQSEFDRFFLKLLEFNRNLTEINRMLIEICPEFIKIQLKSERYQADISMNYIDLEALRSGGYPLRIPSGVEVSSGTPPDLGCLLRMPSGVEVSSGPPPE